MIAFLSQYVYGLGHSNRTKLIAEELQKIMMFNYSIVQTSSQV